MELLSSRTEDETDFERARLAILGVDDTHDPYNQIKLLKVMCNMIHRVIDNRRRSRLVDVIPPGQTAEILSSMKNFINADEKGVAIPLSSLSSLSSSIEVGNIATDSSLKDTTEKSSDDRPKATKYKGRKSSKSTAPVDSISTLGFSTTVYDSLCKKTFGNCDDDVKKDPDYTDEYELTQRRRSTRRTRAITDSDSSIRHQRHHNTRSHPYSRIVGI